MKRESVAFYVTVFGEFERYFLRDCKAGESGSPLTRLFNINGPEQGICFWWRIFPGFLLFAAFPALFAEWMVAMHKPIERNRETKLEMSTEKRRFSRIGFNMAAELTVQGRVYSFSPVDNLSVGGCSFFQEWRRW